MAFLPLELFLLLLTVIYAYIEALFLKIVPRKDKDIRGQVVLITGAGRGIGRELALQFAAKGANLALWDMNEDSVEETATMVKERGTSAYAYTCDVTNKEQVGEVASQVKRDMGDVDILVNNAGIMKCKDIMSLSENDIRATFNVNVVAHFWTIKEFLPSMLSRNQGHIVQIASMAGIVGSPYLTDYCGSKYAVVGMSEALRAELSIKKKEGIKITTVCPKFVNTNLVTGISDRMGFVDRFGQLMEPSFVVTEIMKGVLKNNFMVFIPKDMGSIPLISSLLPMRAKKAMGEVIKSRFVDKLHED